MKDLFALPGARRLAAALGAAAMPAAAKAGASSRTPKAWAALACPLGVGLACAVSVFSASALAGEADFPELPPPAAVVRALQAAPAVRAAGSQVAAEEAERRRLAAGPYEWTLRLGGQRRNTRPAPGPEERYREYAAALERPLRLPGKAALDAELGESGVALAETAHGDALHEAGRALLQDWFVWLKEGEAARQWAEQAVLLGEHARAVQRRRQLGDAARLEAVQAEAALAQAEAQLAQVQLRERRAAAELRRRYPDLSLPEKAVLSEPQALPGEEGEWIAAVLEHSHELGLARGEARRARLAASRSGRELWPDPTLGVHVARERSGEEQVLGLSIAIPLPGAGRRAEADAARARAEAADSREAAALQKISAEAAGLYHAARSARTAWESGRQAAARLEEAAAMTARAYRLGEGSLAELLAARRLANEARLAARLAQLEALELRYRLLLDAHRLWDVDGH